MVDVDPGVRRPVVGVHGQLVAPIARRHALGAIEGGQVAIGELPEHSVHVVAGKRLDGGDAALVDQPVVIGQHRRPRIAASGQRRAICVTHRFDPYAK